MRTLTVTHSHTHIAHTQPQPHWRDTYLHRHVAIRLAATLAAVGGRTKQETTQ